MRNPLSKFFGNLLSKVSSDAGCSRARDLYCYSLTLIEGSLVSRLGDDCSKVLLKSVPDLWNFKFELNCFAPIINLGGSILNSNFEGHFRHPLY